MPVNRARQPAPRRQRVITFATPKVADILFYETEDTKNGEYGRYGKEIPAFGTAHYDKRNWPHHELVFVQPQGPDGQTMRFYYAAKRENQDEYNYEIRDGRELVRTYVIKREDYPSLLTPPSGGDRDSAFSDYGFAGDSVVSLGEPLSTVYIAVQRRYVVPVVEEQIYNATLETVVNIRRSIKPTGYKLSDDGLENEAGKVYEVRHGNKFHDVLVEQYIDDSDLADRTLEVIYGAQKYNLPPRLDTINMVYRSAYVTRFDEDDPTRDVSQFSEDFFIDFDVTVPKVGPFKTKIERVISADPENAIDNFLSSATMLPQPKHEDISVAYAAWSTDPLSARAVARQYRVPSTIHGSVAVTVNGVRGGSDDTDLSTDRVISPNPLEANPTGFTGDLVGDYLIDVDVTKIALDMFLVTATTLQLDGIY